MIGCITWFVSLISPYNMCNNTIAMIIRSLIQYWKLKITFQDNNYFKYIVDIDIIYLEFDNILKSR